MKLIYLPYVWRPQNPYHMLYIQKQPHREPKEKKNNTNKQEPISQENILLHQE